MGLWNKLRTKPFLTIVLNVFLDQLGYSIFLPIIPLIFSDPLSTFYIFKNSPNQHAGLFLMGLLIGTYPLAQFIAAPVLGHLADTVGRKKIISISIFGTFLSYLLAAFAIFARNLPLLFAARAVDGLTGGNISVAQTIITDLSPKAHLPKNFGLIMAMAGLGLILGPFIGATLSDSKIISFFNPTTPFLFIALLYLLNTILVILILPETLKTKVSRRFNFTEPFKSFFHIFSYKRLWTLFAARFAYSSGSIFFTNFIGAYFVFRFTFSAHQLGNLYAYVGLWLVLTQGVLVRFLPKKTNEESIIKLFLISAAGAMLLFLLPNANYLLVVIVPLIAVSFGLVDAYLLAFISRKAGERIQGEILGIAASLKALAQFISPVIAGLIASQLSLNWTIFSAACITAVSWVFFFL